MEIDKADDTSLSQLMCRVSSNPPSAVSIVFRVIRTHPLLHLTSRRHKRSVWDYEVDGVDGRHKFQSALMSNRLELATR